MTNKTICILGATSDVGTALSYAFSKEADTLILTSRKTERLEPLQLDLCNRDLYQSVNLIQLDAGNLEESKVRKIAAQTDILICTIGYLGDQETAIYNSKENQQIIASNFSGLVPVFEIFAETMENKKAGTIIGVSSVAGERGRQSNYLYGSAKAGFTAYLSGLRNRLYQSGVHVITVLPGFMDTQMTADLDLPKFLTSQPDQAAKIIYKAYRKKKNTIYVSPIWRYIMWIIKSIPEFIFKRLKL